MSGDFDYDRIMREQARLIILRAIGEQTGESLNSDILREVLASFAIRQERAWVHEEMTYLASLGAIRIVEAGSLKIGVLTEKGRRHLNREIAIEGVKRPSRPGG